MAYPIQRNNPLQDRFVPTYDFSRWWHVISLALASSAVIVAFCAFPVGCLTFGGEICIQNGFISLGVIALVCLTATLTLAAVCLCFTSKSTLDNPNPRPKNYSLPEPIPLQIENVLQPQETFQAQAPFHLSENDLTLKMSQLSFPPEMGLHVFSYLNSLERIRCASVCRSFWFLSASDELYWEKICKEQDYLPESQETYYRTFLRCEMWMSPRVGLKLSSNTHLPLHDFKCAYLGSHLILSSASKKFTDLQHISIEDGSSTLLKRIQSNLIQIHEDNLFLIEEDEKQSQYFSLYELPAFSLIKSVKLPFDRAGDMTQIGPDFFFIHYSEELGKQKITRFDFQAGTFHELFVFQPKNIPRFCHNSPEGSIMCLGWGQGIYDFDYQGNLRKEIEAPTNPQASDIIGSRFLMNGVDNAVHIWDLQQKKCVRNFTLPGDARIKAIKAHGLGLTICTENAIYTAQLRVSDVLEIG